mgnify:CR=1 FL=1
MGQVLHDFRAGTTRFLITTNVLARGVDVPAVTLVRRRAVLLRLEKAPPGDRMDFLARCLVC